ncbi:MAG TPA: response regulator [Xanthobacteraceae bacterium]|jgi:CheY-like chemotaxis protein
MMPLRVLYVDDEPDIREVVELSLSLDPGLAVRTCASGEEASVAAADWSPDLILCDVMMPVMDGPAMLAHLRQDPRTARIPVVFMTARAQPKEIEHFMSLGASGVIGKPFDPMTLAKFVREHVCVAKLAASRGEFAERLRRDSAVLVESRAPAGTDGHSPERLAQLQDCAHKLAGAAGIFGFAKVSAAAAALERSVVERREGRGRPGRLEAELDALIDCIAQCLSAQAGRRPSTKANSG